MFRDGPCRTARGSSDPRTAIGGAPCRFTTWTSAAARLRQDVGRRSTTLQIALRHLGLSEHADAIIIGLRLWSESGWSNNIPLRYRRACRTSHGMLPTNFGHALVIFGDISLIYRGRLGLVHSVIHSFINIKQQGP